eukprot:scaffold180910_cov15-Tisochrysis_lutea.AAC.1
MHGIARLSISSAGLRRISGLQLECVEGLCRQTCPGSDAQQCMAECHLCRLNIVAEMCSSVLQACDCPGRDVQQCVAAECQFCKIGNAAESQKCSSKSTMQQKCA